MDDELAAKVDTTSAHDALASTERALRRMLEVWEDFAARTEEDNPPSGADVSKARMETARVHGLLLEEIDKAEKRVREFEGRSEDAPIDFDAIRNKIGSRLAHIRTVAEANRVCSVVE